jgi:hypothetical protein
MHKMTTVGVPSGTNLAVHLQKCSHLSNEIRVMQKKIELQLFSEATPRKIGGTEGTIKVLLPQYQVDKCFIILNNCTIQNSKLGPFLMDF